MQQASMWKMSIGLTALAAFGLIVGLSDAGEGDLKAAVRKISGMYQKGDATGAKAAADKLGKKLEELHEAMDLFKLAKKDGLGVGKGVDKNNGIEVKIRELARDGAQAKDMENLEIMGNDIAVLADIALIHTPKANQGKKLVKNWVNWTNEMKEHGLALAAAAKKKSIAEVKMTATKVNQTCNACHGEWR